MSSPPTLTVLVPCFNEQAVLGELHRRLTGVLAPTGLSYELLFVDDGSRDGTLAGLLALQAADPRVAVLGLSRNFGHQLALTAGLDHARGEAVVVIDADLQDPPELIPRMVELWRAGSDVVYGQRRARQGESVFKRGTAALFYRVMRRLTSVEIPVDTGDFRLLSRRVVEAMKRLPEHHRFVRGMVAWVGFRQTPLPYERAPRFAGETKYPLRRMVRFALDAAVSFSFLPLRLTTFAGFAISLGCFGYAGYAIWAKLANDVDLPGWASLMVAVMFLGGVQLLGLGIIGEYLGRVYEEVKARPLYLVGAWHPARDPDAP